jgi:hypothetical protein
MPMTSPELSTNQRSATLIAGLAVLLGVVHLGTMAAQREGLQAALAASDAFVGLENLKARESVIMAHANSPGLDRDVRAGALAEAMRLRSGENGGMDALAARHAALREQSQRAAARAGGLGLGETGLGIAILLIALGEMLGQVVLARVGLGIALAGVVAGLIAAMGWI